jgi:hypothetical protein
LLFRSARLHFGAAVVLEEQKEGMAAFLELASRSTRMPDTDGDPCSTLKFWQLAEGDMRASFSR